MPVYEILRMRRKYLKTSHMSLAKPETNDDGNCQRAGTC